VLVTKMVEVVGEMRKNELQKGVAVLRALILFTSALMALQIADAMGVGTGPAAAYVARERARPRLGKYIFQSCILCVTCPSDIQVGDGDGNHCGAWALRFYSHRVALASGSICVSSSSVRRRDPAISRHVLLQAILISSFALPRHEILRSALIGAGTLH
jgi:hypothetical protein